MEYSPVGNINNFNINFTYNNKVRQKSSANVLSSNYDLGVYKDFLWGNYMRFAITNSVNPANKEDFLNNLLQNDTRIIEFNPVEQYNKLANGDKIALKHLIKAAKALDTVFLKQEHPRSLKIKAELEKKAAQGDELANKTLEVFKMFNGIQDERKNTLFLIKNEKLGAGKNLYPEDLTVKELTSYLKNNLNEASKILSNNTVIKRQGNKLVAIPYQQEFANEYQTAANKLLEASKHSTHKGFNEYLKLQAKALLSNDPEDSFKADAAWTKLSDTPLEFSIARENYADELTCKILEDKDLKKLLKDNNIEPQSKDFIGLRVGIVDIDATRDLQDYKNHLKNMAQLMPLREQYKQSVETANPEEAIKQTLVDVNLVYLGGEEAAARPGVTVAQNLPNDDKLSVKRGCGSRNVFHKQIRNSFDPEYRQKLLDALVEPSQKHLYTTEADHLFTIGHELTHSLGPMKTLNGNDKKAALGEFGDVLEEAKADLGSLVTTDYFVQAGKYSKKQQDEIFLTWAVDQTALEEPSMAQPHGVREIMQFNYFRANGAIKLEKDGKLSINPELFIPTAKKMLEEVIELQLEGNAKKAEAYAKKWFVWTPELQYAADIKKSLKPKIYKKLDQKLAENLMQGV